MTPEQRAYDLMNRVGVWGDNIALAIATAIREAVAEEREANAVIAARVGDVYNIGFCIASDIRARGQQSTPSGDLSAWDNQPGRRPKEVVP
jgi:hypothetical protein